jgi:C1A family cysteine protease
MIRSSGKEAPATSTPVIGLSQMSYGAFHLIPASLDLPIRDQGRRGTCASFATIRAIETLLAQHGKMADLSEQYFYWQSKPQCRVSGCDENQEGAGSLATLFKTAAEGELLPSDNKCPYNKNFDKHNITYAPMQACTAISENERIARPSGYQIVNLNDVPETLLSNKPVVIFALLNKGFATTSVTGVVTEAGKVLDEEGGHAMLLVGLVKLPQAMQAAEGSYCAITANSWGGGWGRGGYTCLTEAWLHRFGMTYGAIESVQANDVALAIKSRSPVH